MGYACYDLGDGFGDRGYAVKDTCSADGCERVINRGMGYLCYECLKYFCEKHLTYGLETECFAGSSGQVCMACFEAQPEERDLDEADE